MDIHSIILPTRPEDELIPATSSKQICHVRIRPRTARTYLTAIEGISEEFDYKKILQKMRKRFCCNGSIQMSKDDKPFIQLQGDQRKNVVDMLVEEDIIEKENIRVHGY